MTENDLRQWQHDSRVNARVRQLAGDAADEIARLHDRLLDTQRLANQWMEKHDKLLGFVQARPAVLKELIAQATNSETAA